MHKDQNGYAVGWAGAAWCPQGFTRACHTAAMTERPLVIAHRGASGYRPENTEGAYELAVRQGADAIEFDLTMTRDGQIVIRHEPEIGGTTDVADHPEFADRRCTRTIDGLAVTGWFTEDFTLAEIRTLRAREPHPHLRPGSAAYDGQWGVPTLREVLQWRERWSEESGRPVGLVPEIKHSTYYAGLGHDLEARLLEQLREHGLAGPRPEALVIVESFEWGNLVRLREAGFAGRLTFLAEAIGGPADLVAAGDERDYDALLTRDSLRELAGVVDGIGPAKTRVVPREASGALGEPTTLVEDAHAAGLIVTPWTLRAVDLHRGDPLRPSDGARTRAEAFEEMLACLRAGVDGFFADEPDLGVAARRTHAVEGVPQE